MLKVVPIQSKDIQKELCELCKIDYDSESFAYRADDEKLIGICQFCFKDGICHISLSYAPDTIDTEAMVIMLRACMNFAFRCGIKTAYLVSASEDIIKLSSFRKDENGFLFIDLEKFYASPCHFSDK